MEKQETHAMLAVVFRKRDSFVKMRKTVKRHFQLLRKLITFKRGNTWTVIDLKR